MNKYSFVKNIYSKELNENIKGFLNGDTIKKLREDPLATIGYVKLGLEYRPDKISAYYYGSTEYDWVIVAVNTTNGIQDLTFGKKLVIPSVDKIVTLGVGNAI